MPAPREIPKTADVSTGQRPALGRGRELLLVEADDLSGDRHPAPRPRERGPRPERLDRADASEPVRAARRDHRDVLAWNEALLDVLPIRRRQPLRGKLRRRRE